MVHGNMTDEKSIMSIQFSISNKETTHFHQNIEIFYVMEGNVSVEVENQIFEARPEDLIVINSNKKHAYTSEDGQVLIGCFYINYEYLADILGTGQMMFWCNSVINRNSVFDEMRRLMARPDYDPESPAMRAVGYRQAIDFLEGRTDAAGFHLAGVAATRQLAKRQMTWMRGMPDLTLLDPEAEGTLEAL